jgi:hypothetical protein
MIGDGTAKCINDSFNRALLSAAEADRSFRIFEPKILRQMSLEDSSLKNAKACIVELAVDMANHIEKETDMVVSAISTEEWDLS